MNLNKQRFAVLIMNSPTMRNVKLKGKCKRALLNHHYFFFTDHHEIGTNPFIHLPHLSALYKHTLLDTELYNWLAKKLISNPVRESTLTLPHLQV